MRAKNLAVVSLVILALSSLGSVLSAGNASAWHRGDRGGWYRSTSYQSDMMVPAGTSINVRLDSGISTENAQPGQSWSGTISQSVYSGDRLMIPAGSPVTGVVTSAAQGTHETAAQIDLAVRSVEVNGQSYAMRADTAPIVAGSHRAKKIGAIAGGAAAGALIGHAVAGGHHGTLIGGLLGGAAGYGLTRHAFRTLELKSGTVVNFTVSEDVVARR